MAEGQDKARKVFVVHGRNGKARDAMFTFLRALGLQPLEWSQARAETGSASPYIGQVLDAAFSGAQAAVVLFTPDEIAYLRAEYADGPDDSETQPAPQARPNVLFEAGMAMGRHPERTVLVELGRMRPFSDVAGRHAVRLADSPEKRKDIAERLKTAGCAVDMSGSDWMTAGDFRPPDEPALPLGRRIPSATAASAVRVDVRYHGRGSRSSGRLEILNLGREPLFDVDLRIVERQKEGSSLQLMSRDLPLPRLPAGKTHMVSVLVLRVDYCDVIVTGRTAEGTPVEEEIFLSLTG